jgi:4-diphosphocytidyl-2-C-methyl-D-erythritol kinase
MVFFPNCKINLGLNITGKTTAQAGNRFLSLPIKMCSGDVENNLCIRAYHLLKKDFPTLPQVQLHLHKTIPMGAGIGGGSADGAFTLKLLNRKFDLAISGEQLIEYALQLGSDCSFFIVNKPSFAKGRGEILNKPAFRLIRLYRSSRFISTSWAFQISKNQ